MRISDWGSDVCSSDLAGVAGGALDDDAAGPQRATLLGILDDRPGGAVLHRATGILELGLAEDLAAGLLGQLAQADEGGVADSADKTVADVHFFFFLDEAPVPEQGWRPAGPRVAARTEGVQGLVSAEAHALTVDYFQIRMISV